MTGNSIQTKLTEISGRVIRSRSFMLSRSGTTERDGLRRQLWDGDDFSPDRHLHIEPLNQIGAHIGAPPVRQICLWFGLLSRL
jgi:hypothetical protein